MNNEALDKYASTVAQKSRRKQVARAKAFLKWLGSREPTKDNIIKYRDKLQERYSDGMIKQDFVIISKLFRVNGWDWPFNRGELITVRETEVEQPALGIDWITDMVDVVLGLKPPEGGITPNEKHLTFLCASTIWGLRRIELIEIRPSCLNLKARTLFIQTAKGGRQRHHVIPEFAVPYLKAWGFKEQISYSMIDNIFGELKAMVGFTGLVSRGVGWHAIRRSAISLAWTAGFNQVQIHNYYRWKLESRDQATRYAGGTMITKDTQSATMQVKDVDLDLDFHKHHPLILIWKEKFDQHGGFK